MTAVQRRFGPTGPTGPIGPTGPLVTGPTGPSGLDSFAVTLGSAAKIPINFFDKNEYKMANYVVYCKQGSSSTASDFKVLHNDIDIDWVEYARLIIGNLEIDFTAEIVGENIVLYAQCLTASSNNPVEVKIIRTKF